MIILFFIILFFSGCANKQSSFLKKDVAVLAEGQTDNYKLIVKNAVQKKCSEKKHVKKIASKTKQKTYQQIEAGLVDVPTPLLAQPIHAFTDEKGSYRLEYYINLSVDKIVSFYKSEMQRFGWQKGIVFLSDDQTLLSFKKSLNSCVILLVPKKSWWKKQKKTHTFLYVS